MGEEESRSHTRRSVLTALGLATAGAACGGGGGGGGSSDSQVSSGPTPTLAAFTDNINDLLTGAPIVSGQITIPGASAIPISNGQYNVSESHRLAIGSKVQDVLIESPGYVSRKTSVAVDSRGLRVDLGHKSIPLDLIPQGDTFQRWLTSRYPNGVVRWNPTEYRGIFFYDRGLWDLVAGEYRIVDRAYALDSITEQSLIKACENISAYTDGALPNTIRRSSETPESDWVEPTGTTARSKTHTVILSDNRVDPAVLWVGCRPKPGGIDGAVLSISPRWTHINAATFAIDLWETVGFREGQVPCSRDGTASPESVLWGRIHYNRKTTNRGNGPILDYQD